MQRKRKGSMSASSIHFPLLIDDWMAVPACFTVATAQYSSGFGCSPMYRRADGCGRCGRPLESVHRAAPPACNLQWHRLILIQGSCSRHLERDVRVAAGLRDFGDWPRGTYPIGELTLGGPIDSSTVRRRK